MARTRAPKTVSSADDIQNRKLDVFISWSGEPSKSIASSLDSWIRLVFQDVKTWISQENLPAGTRWNEGISQALHKINFGILCLTPNNLGSPWLNFEAGALSKLFDASRVIPVLYNLDPTDVHPPLSQFNNVKLDENGAFKLCESLNEVYPAKRSPGDLARLFDVCWPKFEHDLRDISQQHFSSPKKRTDHDMIIEILELVRAFPKKVPARVTSLDDYHERIRFAGQLFNKVRSWPVDAVVELLEKQPPDVLLMLLRQIHHGLESDYRVDELDHLVCVQEAVMDIWEALPTKWMSMDDPRSR